MLGFGFKFLVLSFVFLAIFGNSADASKLSKTKDWLKNPVDNVKQHFNSSVLSSRFFDTKALVDFLKTKPKLYATRALSKAKELLYKSSLGGRIPSDWKARVNKARKLQRNMRNRAENDPLPANFDSREKWPNCESIKEIQNQVGCGCCWAVATSSVMSDRACIGTNGKSQPRISAIDITSCCDECQAKKGDGCQGGYHSRVFDFFKDNGVVTGGKYNSGVGCKPYPFGIANRPMDDNLKGPSCSKQCENSQNYGEKHYGQDTIYPQNVEEMQREIFNNGPIAVYIMVKSDLIKYTKGIYYTAPDATDVGGHFVRAIGWGEEGGVPYWLMANSWGKCWGEGGTFRIVRGKNEANIEKYPVASLYDASKSTSK